jgi:hypothetical protein
VNAAFLVLNPAGINFCSYAGEKFGVAVYFVDDPGDCCDGVAGSVEGLVEDE